MALSLLNATIPTPNAVVGSNTPHPAVLPHEHACQVGAPHVAEDHSSWDETWHLGMRWGPCATCRPSHCVATEFEIVVRIQAAWPACVAGLVPPKPAPFAHPAVLRGRRAGVLL